ncbi:MAG: DegV family protein [Anaerolineaceae bacterium]|jgi:DegV family protein with EDD domain
MPKVAVVTDSTAYLPPDLLEKYNITVSPLQLIWGNETFYDGVDILPDEFYKRMATSKTMPTTSQVSIATHKASFEKLLDEGYNVLGIFMSGKLSGTVQSAVQARELLPKAADKIVIVDSKTTAMAMGFHVLTVARAAQEGANLVECQKLEEECKLRTGVYFVVDNLEYLHRGGRIGGAQALMGIALKIKPVLEIRDGRIDSVEKVRTKRKAVEHMIALVSHQVEGKTPIRLAAFHANAEAEARSLLETASAKLNPVETIFTSVSPVIGAHTGPGTVSLAYMAGM